MTVTGKADASARSREEASRCGAKIKAPALLEAISSGNSVIGPARGFGQSCFVISISGIGFDGLTIDKIAAFHSHSGTEA